MTPSNLRLLGKRLLVRKVEQPTKSTGGIHLLPGYQDSNQMLYCVLQKSAAVEDIEIGDHILTHSFEGAELVWKEENHKVIQADQVLAVIGRTPNAQPA